MQNRELSTLQKKFVEEYLVDMNVTAAAKRAGYTGKNPYQSGYKNMRNPRVNRLIVEKLNQQAVSRRGLAQNLFSELHRVAFDEDLKVAQRLRAITALLQNAEKFKAHSNTSNFGGRITSARSYVSGGVPDDKPLVLMCKCKFPEGMDPVMIRYRNQKMGIVENSS